MTRTGRLVIVCEDRPGIVAAVASFLHLAGANITASDQHSGEPSHGGRFYLRMEFELDASADSERLREAFGREVATPFAMDWRWVDAATRKRMAILVSREEHCLLDLLWRWRSGELSAEIPLVISNHDHARDDVEGFGLPFLHVPVGRGSKPEAERLILEALRDRVDLVVLARYMQILSGELLEGLGVPVINIHHSFLPAFVGADPYQRAHERGVKIIGATAHYVTEELDAGPIIEQDVARVTHRDAPDALVATGRDVERLVLFRAVRWHLEDRIAVDGPRTVIFN